jgi:hypothetical protein
MWRKQEEINTTRRHEILSEWLGEHTSCSTLLYAAALALPALKVEIDAWACE